MTTSTPSNVDLSTVDGLETAALLAEAIAELNGEDIASALSLIEARDPKLGELIRAHLEQRGTVYRITKGEA